MIKTGLVVVLAWAGIVWLYLRFFGLGATDESERKRAQDDFELWKARKKAGHQ
jgi:hypothetical protein